MLIYVYYIKNGEARTAFLCLKTITGTPNAPTIKAALKEALEEHGIYIKAVAFGADGASTMMGVDSGVAALLKRDGKPFLLVFHCICHRLALAAGDAYKEVDFAHDLGGFVQKTYNVFARSAKKRGEFSEVAKKYDEGKVTFKKQHAVRWLSKASALESMCKSINSLADYITDQLSDKEEDDE